MERLTREKAVHEHRKMWYWIVEGTFKRGIKVGKQEYFEAMGIAKEDRPINHCYCCEFYHQQHQPNLIQGCFELCPLNWGVGYRSDYKYARCSAIKYDDRIRDKDGYFRKWQDAKLPDEAIHYAMIIAELPEK